MFLVVGAGHYTFNPSLLKVGNTPFSAFGDDISYTIYPPGADVSGDPRSENWCAAPEVGGTTSGTAGLDLASTGPASVSVTADAVMVSGNNLTVISSIPEAIPASWQAGTVITILAPDAYNVGTTGGGNVFYGDFTELNPSVGLSVSLTFNGQRFDLFVSAYNHWVTCSSRRRWQRGQHHSQRSPNHLRFQHLPRDFYADLGRRAVCHIAISKLHHHVRSH